MSPVRPGELFDRRYLLDRQIGAGGIGTVWLASDTEVRGMPVALKLLHPQLKESPRVVERFAREAKLLSSVSHSNIARLFAFQTEGSTPYLVLEHVAGRTLDKEMGAAEKHFSLERVADIFEAICAGVSHAHAKGIIHRDLKPHNIVLLPEGGRPLLKVLDFGMGRLLEEDPFDATTLGRRLGSLFYMSPEQAVGEAADERSDIFALGTILFELLTLRRAWARAPNGELVPAFSRPVLDVPINGLPAVIERVSSGERPVPSRYRAELTGGIDAAIERCTAVRADDRFASVVEMRDVISPLLREPAQQTDTSTAVETPHSFLAFEDSGSTTDAGDEPKAAKPSPTQTLSESVFADGQDISRTEPLSGEVEATVERSEQRSSLSSPTRMVVIAVATIVLFGLGFWVAALISRMAL